MSTLDPRHPLAKWFAGQFRLAEVASFAELEAKIAALPSERARGDAFEVFAEAWLATQRIPQARVVWPCNTAPLSLQRNLRLPLKDMGVDGLFEAIGDDPTCYQVKFRTGRPRLSWSELATFFGLSDAGCGRLVFTNCDEIASVAEERPGVVFVRGGDLDRLTADDFQAMDAWLSGAVVVRKIKSPRPHQIAAITDILAAFEHQTRATALMACASGKTLVALWVAERLGVRNVLVLLPSLALVRQTLHEWLHETSWSEVEYRCVCSDPTVLPEEDAMIVRQTDLDFPVTTESAVVRRFLERPSTAVRIIFSTYQSCSVVAEALTGLTPFDLGVFDEAHKTAGLEGMRSSLALKDEQLPIARRLFLTATPRHYNVATREKTGDAKIVFSMDVPEVYGVVAHRLPFSAAAEAGIITNYRVVISVVTSEEVTAELIRRGVVLVEGEKIKAPQVANQIALHAAISRYGARKIFTFHARVASAKSFVSSGPEGISTHLPEFHCDYISGDMSTGSRERRMREFENKPRAIMSNARCLTEGVDVPAVDMVAFLSPRRSLVDIVQAAGRAMRRADGKRFGYVFVPLYVEQARGETNLEAVTRSNYDEVWNILNRLQEHDDLLAQIIDDMRVQRGETGGFDDTRFRERVEVLGPSLSLEELRGSIAAACIDAIGDPWSERYGQLVAYYKKHGNCDIPVRYAENKPLATWVVAQRYERKNGGLSDERIARLDQLGFTWDPYSDEWRGNYLELLAFKEKNGHCEISAKSKKHPKLGRWVKSQRVQRKRNRLSSERIELLDRLGFNWAALISTWDARFIEVVEYQKRFGNTRVPVKWKENPKLGQWVVSQRRKRRTQQLRQALVQRLDSIGFEWEVTRAIPGPEVWEAKFAALVAYREKTGGLKFTRNDKEQRTLITWVQDQRALKRQGKMPVDREQRLNAVGFIWESSEPGSEAHWSNRLEELRSYVLKHGTIVIATKDSKGRSLNDWVMHQRALNKNGLLPKEKVAALDALGFIWNPSRKRPGSPNPSHVPAPTSQSWPEMYTMLKGYFQRFGNCDVPEEWEANPSLAQWVQEQRTTRRLQRLTVDQERKLNDLGFSWAIYDARWENKFVALKAWLDITRRGRKVALAPVLARWILTQRQHQIRGILPTERKARLDAVGFEWSPYSDQWSQMFAALEEFRREHGHCRVPTGWAKNPALARWVGVQRARKTAGKILPSREQALDAIGFSWAARRLGGHPQRTAWAEMFGRLSAFYAEHHHTLVPQIYPADRKLGWWVTTQRRNKRKGHLTDGQIKDLDGLGFRWELTVLSALESRTEIALFDQRWTTMLSELREFREEHGHCRVPSGWAKNPQLASWVSVQRQRKKKQKLTSKRISELDALGFDWVAKPNQEGRENPLSPNQSHNRTDTWTAFFDTLVEYKRSRGHCRVPQHWCENPRLAAWVTDQRIEHNKRRLDPNREQMLTQLGFDWDPISTRWDEMFAQLIEYKKKYGDTNVRSSSGEYAQLGNWVRMQRRDKRIGRAISKVRAARLDEIGFVWGFVEPNGWEKMIALLAEFKKSHGHCNVPQKFRENVRFGRWVNTQRLRYKQGRLLPDKKRRLEELGFVWNTKLGVAAPNDG